MSYEQLKLKNQLCFPVYAASRLITREYQPYLAELGITYPQYLVLLLLWENQPLAVNYIADKLILNTNTITPLLKRMETDGIVKRIRSEQDERKVFISLTEYGELLKKKAAKIPEELAAKLMQDSFTTNELTALKEQLGKLINLLNH